MVAPDMSELFKTLSPIFSHVPVSITLDYAEPAVETSGKDKAQ